MAAKKSTLIITEKPSAAAKIAAALSNGKDEKITTKDKVSYYNFQRDGKDYLVGCAVGHLYGIQQTAARGPFPNFEVEWKEASNKKGAAFTKKYFTVLKKLARESNEFIVATDFDREGEVIGWNVARFICKTKDAKRMKFSALTKDELENSFQNLLPNLEWGSAYAGEARHYLDWFYGINLSRGLMKALSKTGQFRILSIGRVQGPALKIIMNRDREIQKFIPTPFWQIFLNIKDLKNQTLEVKYPKDITIESELIKFEHLQGKKANATTTIKEEIVKQPVPFDLTTLQTEAFRYHRIKPTHTLSIAQSLYTDGVISYPRTSSQEYPVGIGYDKILKKLQKYTTLTKYAVRKEPTKGKKVDPAHPAIHPTGEQKKLSGREKTIYDLIVKRFIACFCDPAITQNKKVTIEANGLKFNAKGIQIKEKNWLHVYPSSVKEEEIPTINGEVDITEIRTEKKMTQPPKRYTQASIIKELEKINLGTKSTRAGIVETLSQRGYVTGNSLEPTELGKRLEETLQKFSPEILDVEMTVKMEEEMEQMEFSGKDFDKQEKDILEKAKGAINIIAKHFVDDIDKIGESLADANAKAYEQEKEQNTMTECKICNKGRLRINYGRKFGRYFVSCDNYPECKTIYSLPPKGKPVPVQDKEGNQEMCQECNFPMVQLLQSGKAPWRLCPNPDCVTNADAKKKKEEFKKKLASGEVEIKDGKIIDHTKGKDKAKKKPAKKKVRKKTKK
ncbi:MAG: DNA topoisomerase-1 [Patescibacteria group bacterium]|jgi:DNA topoisomerase-1